MATTTIGTTQSLLATTTPKSAETNLNAEGAYGFLDTFPPGANEPTTGSGDRRYVISSIPESNTFGIVFHGTGAQNTEAKARIWGCSGVTDNGEAVCFYLGTLNLSLGTADAYDSDKFVDKIEIADDATDTPPGMRINPDNGTLRSDAATDANVNRVRLFDWDGPTPIGGGRAELTFKLAIDLAGGRYIAINSDQAGTPPMLAYAADWIKVVMPGESNIVGPDSSGTIFIDTSHVGKMPKHASGLLLHVDAHAAWVESDDSGADPLNTWTDLSGQMTTYDLDGTSTGPALTATGNAVARSPSVVYDDGTPERSTNSSFPAVQDTGTWGIVLVPGSPGGSAATLVAR